MFRKVEVGHEGRECSGMLLTIPLTLTHQISDFPSDFRKKGKIGHDISTKVKFLIMLQFLYLHERIWKLSLQYYNVLVPACLEGVPFSRSLELPSSQVSDNLSLQVPLPSSPSHQNSTDTKCYLPLFLIIFRAFSTHLYMLWNFMENLLEQELWSLVVELLNINKQWISDHPNYRNTIPGHVTITSLLLCFFGSWGVWSFAH